MNACSCGSEMVPSPTSSGVWCLDCDVPSIDETESLQRFGEMMDKAQQWAEQFVDELRRRYRDGEA